MKLICINDLSFIGQAPNLYRAAQLLVGLADTLKIAVSLNRAESVTGHGQLWNVQITPEHKLNDALYECDLREEDRVLLLQIVNNGPYVDQMIVENGTTCACRVGELDVSFSGIAGAAHFDGNLASLMDAQNFSNSRINVLVCGMDGEEKGVDNFTSRGQLEQLERQYVPSEKHRPWGWGTPMDLDDTTALRVLRDGSKVGSQVYGFHNGEYYVFQDDNFGGYHGYPISRHDVPNEAQRSLE